MTENKNGARAGQVALVIGGSGAIGAAIVLRLAAEGMDVAFTYRSNSDKAAALVSEVEALGRKAMSASIEIENSDDIAAFVAQVIEQHGRLDTLVYAAGPPFELQFVAKTAPSEWSRVLDSDVKGCFNSIHAALPHLRATKGVVVAVTAAAVERAIARDILSLAPKAAITALIRGIAFEEGRFGVRAVCVAPGYISGGIGQAIMDAVGEEVTASLINAVPLRRVGSAEEVADVVEFACSQRASYVTGTTLFVSGGMEL